MVSSNVFIKTLPAIVVDGALRHWSQLTPVKHFLLLMPAFHSAKNKWLNQHLFVFLKQTEVKYMFFHGYSIIKINSKQILDNNDIQCEYINSKYLTFWIKYVRN
jgi:hypothetical protein